MQAEQDIHKFIGMQQDLSPSQATSQFLYEAHNMRITAREGDTLLTLTNERGPKEFIAIPKGKFLGHCVLNKYVVVFTHDESTSKDYIYRIDTDAVECKQLYCGNLGFSLDNPIETLGSYENDNIQKVYWTDAINQPRVINIMKDTSSYDDASFDFVQDLQLREKVYVIKKIDSAGIFAPGTIQYAFTYYNKYGQESNIFYTTPLLYVSPRDRGGSPEESIGNAFSITITNIDTRFEYLRIYSIQRTSTNATPIVKNVIDLEISSSDSISYVDTGTNGESVDPTALLYVGGEEILADTIAQKDGTMFLGNIEIKRPQVDDGTEGIKEAIKDSFASNMKCAFRTALLQNASEAPYLYNTSLNATNTAKTTTVPTGGFKAREYYRLGVQFQYKNGKWSDPIWVKDMKETNKPSFDAGDLTRRTLNIPIFNSSSDDDALRTLYNKGYRSIRPVVTFPQSFERTVVCQGVANPTVYTDKQRSVNQDLYAQASWFFRPYTNSSTTLYEAAYGTLCSPTYSGTIPYNQCAFRKPTTAESEGVWSGEAAVLSGKKPTRLAEVQGYYNDDKQFKIDWNMFTLNSPDFIYDDQSIILDYTDIYARVVGHVNIEKTLSTLNIETKTPTIHEDSTGFVKEAYIGDTSHGIVSGLFYEDYLVNDLAQDTDDASKGEIRAFNKENAPVKYLIYPWSKEGSINNDFNRPANFGVKSTELLKKCISNFRYANTSWDTVADLKEKMTDTPKMFRSDQMTLLKLTEGTYYGNVDTLLTPDESYDVMFCAGIYDGYGEDKYSNVYTYSDDMSKNLLGSPKAPTMTSENWMTLAYGNDDYDKPGIYKYCSGVSWRYWGTDNVLGDYYPSTVKCRQPVRMKYKSTPHLVMNISSMNGLLDYMETPAIDKYALPIVEMYRTYNENTMFGGTTDDALKANLWIPCGEPVSIGVDRIISISYAYGDTWYQRYDCLKTYPFTFEDHNQVVEILSFPVETHCNLDGRYDANRGQLDNLNMSPINYNLSNPVYSQANNYFNYRIADNDYYKLNKFANQFTWTVQKNAAAEIDEWTNITLASTYDTDGDKGSINSINLWNDKLLCFQTTGVSVINFNTRAEIPVKEGAPIEIANSYRVDGITYVITGMGCRNKWAIQVTPSGVYFVDSVSQDLQLLSSQTANLSQTKNMQIWSEKQKSSSWTPNDYSAQLFYDVVNGDLYYNTEDTSLNFCEQTGYFTSFFSYGGVDRMFNVENAFYAIKGNMMYKMFEGTPNKFFGNYESYDMTFVCNGQKTQSADESLSDKIFTNLEFRADLWNDKFEGSLNDNKPFDYLRIWNEYQDSLDNNFILKERSDVNLAKLYRIWRTQLPRDFTNRRDRIRNPWCKIKLGIYNNDDIANEKLFNIHDMMVTYRI